MFRRGCIKRALTSSCDCPKCQSERVDDQERDRLARYQAGLLEERRGLVFAFDQAIKLGEARERLPNPHGPIGATIVGERTGLEIARDLQAALAAVDAEIKRAGALNR
jgi:hypothetical protein